MPSWCRCLTISRAFWEGSSPSVCVVPLFHYYKSSRSISTWPTPPAAGGGGGERRKLCNGLITSSRGLCCGCCEDGASSSSVLAVGGFEEEVCSFRNASGNDDGGCGLLALRLLSSSSSTDAPASRDALASFRWGGSVLLGAGALVVVEGNAASEVARTRRNT